MIDTFVLDRGLKKIKFDELEKHAQSKNKNIWIDITSPTKDEFKQLKKLFKLHPLTVEDCLKTARTRLKVENFGNYLFIVIYGFPENGKRLYELDFILGKNFLISNHFESIKTFENLKTNPEKIETILSGGADFMLHKLIDVEIDKFMTTLSGYEGMVDKIEKRALEEPDQHLVSQIFRLRKRFMSIRRLANLQKEKLLELSTEKHAFISTKIKPYFRDVFDHMLAATELITTYREILSNSLELSLLSTSNRMNEVMKTLTVIATIVLPLTFIASIYGMNFQFLPELHWKYGYFFALGLMAAIAIGMLFYFKRKGWF